MPEHNPGQMGGTMRLGKRRTVFTEETGVLSRFQLNLSIFNLTHSFSFKGNCMAIKMKLTKDIAIVTKQALSTAVILYYDANLSGESHLCRRVF